MNLFKCVLKEKERSSLKKLFVISDIHGELSMLKELLTFWDPENEILVIAGDMVDRGENPYETVVHLLALQHHYPGQVKLLKGNHEDLFLEWLDDPEGRRSFFPNGGGRKTILSFMAILPDMAAFVDGDGKFIVSHSELASLIKERFPAVIQAIRDLSLSYRKGDFLIVHAGIRLDLPFKEQDATDLLWIRQEFYGEDVTNDTGLQIVFGHTPTPVLTRTTNTDVWMSSCKTKIGIDGGAVFGGTLNGLKINTETNELEMIQVKHPFLDGYQNDAL